MKLKLDENIGTRGRRLLTDAGHDVATVLEQSLGGAPDERLFQICSAEGRALITLDHDFAQTLRFPPEHSAGLVVLQLRKRAGPQALLNRIGELITALERPPLDASSGSSSRGASASISRRMIDSRLCKPPSAAFA